MAKYTSPLGTGLDADQTIVRAYDEVNNCHRVDAKVTATIGSVDVVIDSASGDNIAIKDSQGNELDVNLDGSINVVVKDITLDKNNDSVTVHQGTTPWVSAIKQSNGTDITSANPLPVTTLEEPYTNIYTFNAISTVASGIETTILTYTVPVGKTASIRLSEMTGTNIATFNLYLGLTLINRKRTFFGNLNTAMEFANRGYTLTAGQIVSLKVIHNRPFAGNFEANLQIRESL